MKITKEFFVSIRREVFLVNQKYYNKFEHSIQVFLFALHYHSLWICLILILSLPNFINLFVFQLRFRSPWNFTTMVYMIKNVWTYGSKETTLSFVRFLFFIEKTSFPLSSIYIFYIYRVDKPDFYLRIEYSNILIWSTIHSSITLYSKRKTYQMICNTFWKDWKGVW